MRCLKDKTFYITILLLLILVIALRTPLDTDMWWHLRAGEETLKASKVYQIDTLSYTREGYNWVNHSWLSQVFMIVLYKIGKFRALSLWVALTAMISMYFVYIQMEGNELLKMFIVLFAAFIASVVWSPRPQLFSLLLFSLVGVIVFQYKWRNKNSLIWLLPIFITWSNLHGGYILGIILILSVIAGEIFNRITKVNHGSVMSWEQIGNLGLWAALGFFAAAINPNGIKMWTIPFQTVGVESLQNLIQEWASPDFHQPLQQLMLVFLFGAFTAVGFSSLILDGSELACFVIFGYLALSARRNFGPFAMVTAPILARHINSIFSDWKEKIPKELKIIQNALAYQKSSNKNLNETVRLTINWIVVFLLLFVAGYKWISVTGKDFVDMQEREYFPVGAVEFIKQNKYPGRLFNSYNWGGYLSWKLRDYPVFVDGRTDLFGDEIISEWNLILNGNTGWETHLERWNVNLILIESELPLNNMLPISGWKKAYKDDLATVYFRE